MVEVMMNTVNENCNYPLISVIMAAYNSERFIAASIDSVFSQTYGNWELIIIDDCSTDETVNIIKSYNSDKIVLLQNEKNSGPAFSRNRGIEAAKGKYIAILDSDDIALDYRFETQLSQFRSNPKLVFTSGAATVIDKNGKDLNIVYSSPMEFFKLKLNLLFRCPIIHSTVMYSAKFIRENGLKYDLDFPCNQDYKMWTDFVMYEDIQMNVDSRIYVKYRVSEGQISTKKRDKQLMYGKILREAYLNRLNVQYTADTLRVLTYLDSDCYDDSVSVSCCEKTLMDLRHNLMSVFLSKDIDSIILDNLRCLYLKKSNCKLIAGIKYLNAIIKLKVFN